MDKRKLVAKNKYDSVHNELLEVGVRLLSSERLTEISLNTISEYTNVSKTTIYEHFNSSFNAFLSEVIIHVGKKIQNNDIFPESVNVEFATILEDKTIRMKVWERGAGRTLACGSGACATLVAANQQNLSLRKNDIILDGGKLTIDWLETGDIIMSGEVNLVFKGNFYCD